MLSRDITSVVDMWVTGTDLKINAFHSLFFSRNWRNYKHNQLTSSKVDPSRIG